MNEVINIKEKFTLFSDYLSPKRIEKLNGQQIILAKLKGEFVFHKHDHQDELFSIHAEMESISHKIEDAEPSELVELADRMLEIERKLSRISRLGAGEELVPRNKPTRPYEHQSFEEYVPKGDWNIDETDVSASDLLVEQKSILRPIVVLQSESHEEE